MPDPAPAPLSRTSLLTRVILYGVSASVWLLLAAYGRGGLLRAGGGVVGAINLAMMAGYLARYRRVRRSDAGG